MRISRPNQSHTSLIVPVRNASLCSPQSRGVSCVSSVFCVSLTSNSDLIFFKNKRTESCIVITSICASTVRLHSCSRNSGLHTQKMNRLHPNSIMHILHTVLYIFPKVLTRRIWLSINKPSNNLFLHPRDLNVCFWSNTLGEIRC